MTDWTLRITIIVPESLVDCANHLAACLGRSPADQNSFDQCKYRDEHQNYYAVASTLARPQILTAVESPQRPEWDVDEQVDMIKVQQALNSLSLFHSPPWPQASPTDILACIHPDAHLVLRQTGLDTDS